jgi:hypothetical protein
VSFLDRLFGLRRPQPTSRMPGGWGARAPSEEQALQRYRYLVRTAPPEALEEMYLEAFSRLPPEQRAQAARALDALLPAGERSRGAADSDPHTLARRATRAELLRPGTVERAFGGLRVDAGAPGGPQRGWRGEGYPEPRRGWGASPGWGSGWGMGAGLGGMFAGSLLSSFVGSAIGSVVAHQFLDGFDGHPGHDGYADGHGDPDGSGLDDAQALGPDEGSSWDASDTGVESGTDFDDGDFGGDDL